jgi:hypothetical protein
MNDNQSVCIQLNTGRSIYLETIFQYKTYSGLMEGFPTKSTNAEIVNSAQLYAIEKLWGGDSAYLIETKQVSMNIPKERWFTPNDEDEPMKLPPICCLGSFYCSQPAQDTNAGFSTMKIVWFQDNFAMPIDTKVIVKIQDVDWNHHAIDGNW